MKFACLFALLCCLGDSLYAQCGPGGCRAPNYGSFGGYSSGYSPVYTQPGYGSQVTIAAPVQTYYVAPEYVAAPRAELFNTVQTGPGTYRAVNKQNGAIWTWNNYESCWVHRGYEQQQAMLQQRVEAPQPEANRQAYQSSKGRGCQCGCGCKGCRCGR